MPAMFTFYIGFPALILGIIIYISIKRKLFAKFSNLSNLTIFFILLGATVSFTIGILLLFILYIYSFTLFIHIFPTYIVVLTTLTIMRLIPYSLSNTKVVLTFLLLSTLLGLNTQIIPLLSGIFQPQNTVKEQIHEVMHLNKHDVLELTGQVSDLPSSYITHDFISFGANEGVGGFWNYPKYNTSLNITTLLDNREITYTQKNESLNNLHINYIDNNDLYTLTIQIMKNSKVLSSLTIKDRLPLKETVLSKARNLESFPLRLEYLLRHNIWNEVLFLMDEQKNISSVIANFLDKSIQLPVANIDWTEHLHSFNSNLLYESKIEDCSKLKSDNYNDYPFNQWKKANNDTNIKSIAYGYVVDVNGTFHPTKTYASDLARWSYPDFAFSSAEYIYAFMNFRTVQDKKVRLFQFSTNGNLLQYLHINFPENVVLDGRDWHPISHIAIRGKRMKFRVYNIYEHKNKNTECKYYELETKF